MHRYIHTHIHTYRSLVFNAAQLHVGFALAQASDQIGGELAHGIDLARDWLGRFLSMGLKRIEALGFNQI